MAAFQAGDIVVYRVGSGAAALSSSSTAVYLDEYSPSGALVQTVALPTADAGSNHALTASGSATSEGLLTRSADGHYLLLTGYDAAPGVATITGTTSAADPRVVGRVGADGVIDTTTALTNFGSANNIRSVASADGVAIYVGGPTGIAYTTDGATTATSLSTQNTRAVEVVGGQLYADTSSGSTLRVFSVGSGLPTTGTQTLTELSGVPASGGSPYEFVLLHVAATGTAADTLYVADDTSATGSTGITKYSLDNGVWTAHGSVTGAYRGLTASVTNGVVTLYATTTETSANKLVALTDSTGFDGTLSGTPTVLATAATNEVFRGAAFAPVAAGDTTPPQLQSVSPTEGATGVATNAALTITFNEAVKAGAGSISLTDGAGDVRTISVTDTTQVAFNGATLKITPTQALMAGDTYHVTFASGVVLDTAGNAYAGLPANTLDFTTAAPVDTTPPTLASTTPTENATGVGTAGSIVLTFSEAVKAGTGNITLVDAADSSRNVVIAVTSSQVTFSGSTVTITPTAALHAGDMYHVSVDGTAISDIAGNAYMGGADVLDFTTAPPAGAFPTGPQSATFAITAAGTYQLAAGQTFTETGAVTAVTASDTDTALTSLDIEGALSGAAGKKGVVETVPNGQLTVGASGSLHTTDADAFQFTQPSGGGGHANVTNLGSIVSASTITTPNTAGTGTTAHGYGLNFNAATGGSSATDHVSGGTISNGSTSNSTALIESDSDDAVRLGNDQTLTNYGRIVGAGPVDDSADNNGQKGSGYTTNKVYDSSRGVEINGHAHDTVDNFGRIEGAQHGVDAGDTADTDITVINEVGGVIIGHNGSGVGSDGATANAANASDVTVTNSGSIYGEYHPTYDRSGAATTDGDGDGVDIDGAGTVVNNVGATIAGAGVDSNGQPVLSGQGAGGYDSEGRLNHSEGLSLGGGSVDNFGVISGADYGVTVNNDDNANRSGVASTQIVNEVGGTITGQNGYAIRLENKGAAGVDTDTITNHGVITGNGAIPAATGTATLENGSADPNTVGTVNGVAYQAGAGDTNRFVLGDGAAIQTGEGNDTVLNDGAIVGNSGRAISLEGGDDTLTLYAAGTVTGAIDGGVGTDTLNLTTGTSGATANTLAGVTNFETLNVLKGAWTLTDAETYTTTAISTGASLQLGTGGTTGSLAGAVTDSGALIVDRSDAVTLGAGVSGGNAGTLSQIGAGTTTLSAAHGFAGVTLAAGVLDVAATGATSAITFAPSQGATPLLRVETAAVASGGYAPVIKGFAAGETLDAVGVGTNATAVLGAGNVLTVSGSGGTETFNLDPSQSFAGKAFSTAADAGATGVNITVVTAQVTSGVLYANNFDSYTGAGLSPGGTTAGTLDSNVFMAVGFSDSQPGYGATVGTGDYGRGLLQPSADPSTAGLYSGVTGQSGAGDHALLIQPTGAEFDVNGYVELRVKNTTGNTVTSLSTAFDWVYHNNEPRADNLQVAYSTDGVNYTLLPAANLTTPGTADTASPVPFTYVHESLTLPSGSVVAPDSYLYLRFEHPSSSGSGNRDEVGIDNVSIAYGAVSNVPVLSAGNVTQNEGDSGTTPFVFTIQRAGNLSQTTTVHYATADGTATAGSDYTAVMGDLTFAPNETSKTVTVLVNGDTTQEANETFNLVLSSAVNASLPTTPIVGTITNDDTSTLGIADIQGASQTSPFAGATVTTQGVVTAIKTGSGGGFYIQDSLTTGPAGASHGLFVFTAATPTGVTVGDAVTVSGVVTEYGAGNNNLSTTELNNPTFTVGTHANAVTPIVIGTGGVLPPTTTIAPGSPYNPATSGADFYESLEGQIVTIHNAQAVDATYSNSTWVVADNGAEATGVNARGGITVSATDFNPERIQIYSSALNATMGEQLGDITGVITYFSKNSASDPSIGGEYELVPTSTITAPSTPPTLARPTTALQGDASHVSIGAYNVENLGPVEPGVPQATVDARFAQLGRDIAQNLHAPDILGLEEIQDADGEGTGTDLSGATTLNKLITAIAAAGGPTYQYVEIAPTTAGSTGGAPGGNIRSAYLYNPARVTYVAGSAQLISDPNLSDGDAFANSRKPLAAQFVFNGQTINAIDVHDYARSGSDELFGATQPPVNSGDQRRVDQTAAVNAYVNQLLATNSAAKITVQGDFNGFQFEPTLTQLTHSGGGQLNQLSDLLPANERYSTTFEGDAQEIDHLLVSDSLDAGAQFDIVHLNTGQGAANQASDHDPIVSLLSVPVTAGANTAPSLSGTHASSVRGTATDLLFSGVTVTDPDTPAQMETATISFTFASGTLTGAGTPSEKAGVATYTLSAASAAALTTALDAVTFQAAPSAAGAVTSTTVTLSVSDGTASSASDTTTVVTATSALQKALGDVNADGTSDVVLQKGGTVLAGLLQNGSLQSNVTVGTGASGFTVVGKGDFNGDGTADLLLQNGSTVVTWTLHNGAYQSGHTVTTALPSGTTIVGTGDFNGDGTTDVLLQDSSGGVVAWLMQNGTYQSGSTIAAGGSGFRVVGTGDFDGDGTTDILLQNGASGAVVDWTIRNGAYAGGHAVASGTGGSTVVGTGDFNGDGTSDILLQNASTGAVVEAFLQNGSLQSSQTLSSSAGGYTVVGTGDYNGDGTTDVLLQSGGTVVDWIILAGQYSTAHVLTTGASGYGVV